MGSFQFKWVVSEFEAIRRLPGVEAELDRRAEAIAEAAGDGYEWSGSDGKSRSRAGVYPTTFKAIRDNAKNNTLLKALDAGRG